MKVIAIVNLPFDVDPSKEDAYFAMRDGKYCQKVYLRPLPQKIVGKQAKYIPAYSLGWNECIDEITGETE